MDPLCMPPVGIHYAGGDRAELETMADVASDACYVPWETRIVVGPDGTVVDVTAIPGYDLDPAIRDCILAALVGLDSRALQGGRSAPRRSS